VSAEPGELAPQDHPLVAYYRGYCRERSGGSGRPDYAAASKLSTRYVFPNRPGTIPVLRAALAADPKDATAHFLLGSLHLSGGRVDEAVAAWERALELDPTIPVLHRNLGLTLLHARKDAKAALDVLLQGLAVDGGNVALYLAADAAQSILGRPTEEHVRMLERYPDREAMPPVLVRKLALALAEAGRGDEAETLFAGRFFPREENGTNIRQVYVEVRLRHAMALARAGKADEAVAIVNGLADAAPGLEFTRTGMSPFIDGGRVQYLIGDILSAAGRKSEARAHWSGVAKARDSFHLTPVFEALAARRLGTIDEAASRRDLEASLARAEAFLEQGTSFPGIALYAQALHLRALGREGEARERFLRVFLLPDQRLAQFLARRALEANDPL
jgi:tetratricopeptide (TPR) repeat protein